MGGVHHPRPAVDRQRAVHVPGSRRVLRGLPCPRRVGWMMPTVAFNGVRVLVVGLAKSGQAATTALHRHGAQVTAVDGADTEQLRGVVDALQAEGVAAHLGADLGSSDWLTGTDVVVARDRKSTRLNS